MGRIKLLESALSDQIAAGEVVERPSSVAKELLENAIDAGASQITLEYELGGVSRLRIVDNGCGMSPDDALLSVRRHATSKITHIDDLNRISSLGFRGEALASIASVSKFRLKTKEEDQLVASLVKVTGGHCEPLGEAAGPHGTEIIVEDLFFNVPARKKFLKKPETEAAHILETVQRLSVGYPNIAFKVIRDGRNVLDVPSHRTLDDRVHHLFPKKMVEDARTMTVPGALGLTGLIGNPKNARGTTRHYYTMINGRIVKDRVLMAAIQSGCGNALQRGKHPFAVLNLNLPAQMVDVNVHPAKTEVRFADSQKIYRMVARSVELALSQRNEQEQSLLSARGSQRTVPAIEIKRIVEQETASPQPAENAPARLSGIERQKRRVFDAMAKLAERKFTTSPSPLPMTASSASGQSDSAASTQPKFEPLRDNGQHQFSDSKQRQDEGQPSLFAAGDQRVSSQDTKSRVVDAEPIPDRHTDDRYGTEKNQQPVVTDPENGARAPLAGSQPELSAARTLEAESGDASPWWSCRPVYFSRGLASFSVVEGLAVVNVSALKRAIYLDEVRHGAFQFVVFEKASLVKFKSSGRAAKVVEQLAALGIRSELFGQSQIRLDERTQLLPEQTVGCVARVLSSTSFQDGRSLQQELLELITSTPFDLAQVLKSYPNWVNRLDDFTTHVLAVEQS